MGNEADADAFGYSRARQLYADSAELEQIGQALQQARRELDTLTTAAVLHARARGYAWNDIGHALSVSRQAVQQKYGSL